MKEGDCDKRGISRITFYVLFMTIFVLIIINIILFWMGIIKPSYFFETNEILGDYIISKDGKDAFLKLDYKGLDEDSI